MTTFIRLFFIGLAAALTFLVFAIGFGTIITWLGSFMTKETKDMVGIGVFLSIFGIPGLALAGLIIEFVWETRPSALAAAPVLKEEVADAKVSE